MHRLPPPPPPLISIFFRPELALRQIVFAVLLLLLLAFAPPLLNQSIIASVKADHSENLPLCEQAPAQLPRWELEFALERSASFYLPSMPGIVPSVPALRTEYAGEHPEYYNELDARDGNFIYGIFGLVPDTDYLLEYYLADSFNATCLYVEGHLQTGFRTLPEPGGDMMDSMAADDMPAPAPAVTGELTGNFVQYLWNQMTGISDSQGVLFSFPVEQAVTIKRYTDISAVANAELQAAPRLFIDAIAFESALDAKAGISGEICYPGRPNLYFLQKTDGLPILMIPELSPRIGPDGELQYSCYAANRAGMLVRLRSD